VVSKVILSISSRCKTIDYISRQSVGYSAVRSYHRVLYPRPTMAPSKTLPLPPQSTRIVLRYHTTILYFPITLLSWYFKTPSSIYNTPCVKTSDIHVFPSHRPHLRTRSLLLAPTLEHIIRFQLQLRTQHHFFIQSKNVILKAVASPVEEKILLNVYVV
jgi:hypothetical protein